MFVVCMIHWLMIYNSVTIPCHRFWHNFYMYDKFCGFSFIKRSWVRSTIVWQMCLTHFKGGLVPKSWQFWKHFSRISSFPPWKGYSSLLQEIPCYRKYFFVSRNFWSWDCYFDYGRWKLYTWGTSNSIDIRNSSMPSIFKIYKLLIYKEFQNCLYI